MLPANLVLEHVHSQPRIRDETHLAEIQSEDPIDQPTHNIMAISRRADQRFQR